MQHFHADILKDIAQASRPKERNKGTKQLTIRFDERHLLHLRDLKISPIRACKEFVRQTLLAHKIDLQRPHNDELWGEVEDSTVESGHRPITWGEARTLGLAEEPAAEGELPAPTPAVTI